MIYIVFSSISYVNKARNLLKKQYVRSNIIQSPGQISTGKCSYSLLVSPSDIYLAMDVLIENNCNILGVYEEKDGGMHEFGLY